VGGGGIPDAGAREGGCEHRRAAAASHLIAPGIGRPAGGRAGQVARGSCADSDADAAELACVGSSSGSGRARADAGLVVEELLGVDGFELGAVLLTLLRR